MLDVEVIESAEAARSALDPTRARLLRELATPQSAAMLGAKLGIPRQKLNYHLHQLEAHGLVSLHDTRKHGGLTERVPQATARSYAIDPGAEAPQGDRMSARYLIAVASRLIREVGRNRSAATLTID